MQASPNMDAVGYGLFAGIFALSIFIGVVTIVEGFVLRLMGWPPPGRPFLDAFIMNIISTIVGALFSPVVGLVGIGMWIGLSWVASVISESITIILLRKMPLGFVVRPITVANIASYVLISVWVYAAGGFDLLK
jgi:hypothetical protein